MNRGKQIFTLPPQKYRKPYNPLTNNSLIKTNNETENLKNENLKNEKSNQIITQSATSEFTKKEIITTSPTNVEDHSKILESLKKDATFNEPKIVPNNNAMVLHDNFKHETNTQNSSAKPDGRPLVVPNNTNNSQITTSTSNQQLQGNVLQTSGLTGIWDNDTLFCAVMVMVITFIVILFIAGIYLLCKIGWIWRKEVKIHIQEMNS